MNFIGVRKDEQSKELIISNLFTSDFASFKVSLSSSAQENLRGMLITGIAWELSWVKCLNQLTLMPWLKCSSSLETRVSTVEGYLRKMVEEINILPPQISHDAKRFNMTPFASISMDLLGV